MKPLTLQQAREFIAKTSGWTNFLHVSDSHIRAIPPNDDLRQELPNVFDPNCREALFWMHEAEETLCGNLYKLFNDRETHERWCAYQAHLRYCIRATAPQRARAFCQVFGFSVEDV